MDNNDPQITYLNAIYGYSQYKTAISKWREKSWKLHALCCLLCVLSAAFILYKGLQNQEEERAILARILHRELSQKMAQHEAILPLIPHQDSHKTLSLLNTKFPEIIDFYASSTLHNSLMHSFTASSCPRTVFVIPENYSSLDRQENEYREKAMPCTFIKHIIVEALKEHHKKQALLNAQKVKNQPVIEQSTAYWLFDTQNQVAILIDTHILFAGLSFYDQFKHIQLFWHDLPIYENQVTAQKGYWHWIKGVGGTTQSFTLSIEANPNLRSLPWFIALLISFFWIILLNIVIYHRIQHHKQNIADMREKYFQLSRLNMFGEITAGMMHELNQPLTAMLSYTQAAIRLIDQNPITSKQLLEKSILQLKRVDSLIQHLRKELRQDTYNLQKIDIAESWQYVQLLLEQEIAETNTKIVSNIERPLPWIKADPIWIQQILHNLLSNALCALDSTPIEERWITFAASVEETNDYPKIPHRLKMTITDNGIGLSDLTQDKLFMPFYSTKVEGLGLGLVLIETLITRLNGNIEAENTKDAGARFILYLPVEYDPIQNNQPQTEYR